MKKENSKNSVKWAVTMIALFMINVLVSGQSSVLNRQMTKFNGKGFSIEYPSNWTVDNEYGLAEALNVDAVIGGPDNEIIYFTLKKENNVDVSFEEMLEYYKQFYASKQGGSASGIKVGKYNAILSTTRIKNPESGNSMITLIYRIKSGTVVYEFSFNLKYTSEENFKTQTTIVDKIIDSFKEIH